MSSVVGVLVETRQGWLPVTPGVFDENADLAFMQGQCVAYAIAAAEITGWPVVLHIMSDTASGDVFVLHAVVSDPDGMLHDVHGEHEPEGFMESADDTWGSGETMLVEVNAASLSVMCEGNPSLFAQDVATARSFARQHFA